MKSNRSRLLKMRPIDRSYSRACVTITSSGVCFVSKQLASTSFRRQVLSMLLVQRWRNLSSNVRLSNLLISSCFAPNTLFLSSYTHIVLNISYTTWVRAVAYQKQLSGPKLMGVWARAACNNLGPLFISATLEVNNFKFGIQLGLGE